MKTFEKHLDKVDLAKKRLCQAIELLLNCKGYKKAEAIAENEITRTWDEKREKDS